MKPFFMARPRLLGAIAGLLFLLAAEILFIYLRQLVRGGFPDLNPSSTWDTFLYLGIYKALLLGLFIGRDCGLAASEWLSGRPKNAKLTMQMTGFCIVAVHVVLFPMAFPLSIVDSFSMEIPLPRQFHQIIDWCLANFLLQFGIFLWVLGRVLRDKSSKTTQITENLRL